MQGPGSYYSAYCVNNLADIDLVPVFTVICDRNVLRLLQFIRESGFTEKTCEMDEVATGFKVRPYFGDFNAQFALMERYRKNTRISDVVDISVLIKGCVIHLIIVPLFNVSIGCVGLL